MAKRMGEDRALRGWTWVGMTMARSLPLEAQTLPPVRLEGLAQANPGREAKGIEVLSRS